MFYFLIPALIFWYALFLVACDKPEPVGNNVAVNSSDMNFSDNCRPKTDPRCH